MVLRRYRRDLFLRRTIGLHVGARHCRIDVHEHAVGLGRRRSFRHRDAFSHRQQYVPVPCRFVHVPCSIEGTEHQRLVGRTHLLGAEREHDIGRTRADVDARHMHRSGGSRAGILDIDDGHTLDADRPRDQLASDHVLAFHVALHAVTEEHRFDIARPATGVGECLYRGVGRQVLEAPVELFAELRHADAGDEDVAHWPVNSGLRFSANAVSPSRRSCEKA